MKNLCLLSILLAMLFSCNSKEKYQGNWIYSWNSTNNYDAPSEVIISDDSIKFRYTYFDFWNNYSYEIEDSNILFDENILNLKTDKDTLIFNNHLKFIRVLNEEKKKELEKEASNMEINLPKLKGSTFENSNNLRDYIFVRFGKRHDNGEFSLRLNDKYGEPFELYHFISNMSSSKRGEVPTYYDYYFFIDKNSSMKDVEKLFLSMAAMNETRILFVNDISINLQKMDFNFYKLNCLSQKISPFIQRNYFDDKIGFCGPPPPPPISFIDNKSPVIYLLLINNEVFFENKKIEISEIEKLIQKSISNNSIIFSLYDLQSNYGSFLELNLAIKSAYTNVREEKSQKEYGKPFFDLDIEESNSIKVAIPMKDIWNYSIPHYNSILQHYNSVMGNGYKFNGLDVVPIDLLIK